MSQLASSSLPHPSPLKGDSCSSIDYSDTASSLPLLPESAANRDSKPAIDESSHPPALPAIMSSGKQREKRKLSIAIGLCLVFFALELVGGLWSGSLALLSDSFHLLTDVISFIISLSAIIISGWPATRRFTYGYHRAETVGAFVSILFIYILTAFLLWEAIERVQNPVPINGTMMFVIALIGVIVNIVLGLTLHEFHHHGHDHGHSHGTDEENKDGHDHGHSHSHNHDDHHHDHHHHHHHHHENINIRAAVLHVLGDLLSSIGVLIASILIMVEDYRNPPSENHINKFLVADPICTFVFSVLVIVTTVPLMRECILVFMDSAPRGTCAAEMKDLLLDSFPGIRDVRDIKLWNVAANIPACIVSISLSSKNAAESNRISALPSAVSVDTLLPAVKENVSIPVEDEEELAQNDSFEEKLAQTFDPKNLELSPELPLLTSPKCEHRCSIHLRHLSSPDQYLVSSADEARMLFLRNHALIQLKIRKLLWKRYRITRDHCFIVIDYVE